RTAPTPIPAACPAASSAGSPSPARSSTRRRCCSPTNPRATSTKTPRPTSSTCSNGCSARNRSASSSSPTISNSPSARSAATRCAKACSRRATCPRSRPRRNAVSARPGSGPSSPRRARPAPVAAGAPIRLGASLWGGVKAFLIAAAVIFAAILAADIGVEKYQAMRVRERAARVAALQHLALNRLRGDVQSVADLGDGRYELTTYLEDVGGAEPIYVMAPDMRAYVQVGTVWQEVPMTPADDGVTGVTKIERKHTYRYLFDARVRDFAQLLPNYMHVRFSGTMLVSPSSTPNGDVFERKDNYYVYLKPFDVADEVVLKR